MKKVNCRKCVNFIRESSESVEIDGKPKTKCLVECAIYGEVEVIGGGKKIWHRCQKYDENPEKTMRVKKSEAKDRINREIGSRIRKIRETLGLTQTQFGEKTGSSHQLMCLIERGKISPRLELLISLVIDYKVDGNFLLTGKGKMFKGRR